MKTENSTTSPYLTEVIKKPTKNQHYETHNEPKNSILSNSQTKSLSQSKPKKLTNKPKNIQQINPNIQDQKYYLSQSAHDSKRRSRHAKLAHSKSKNFSKSRERNRHKKNFYNNTKNSYSYTDYTNQLKHSLDIESHLVRENIKKLENEILELSHVGLPKSESRNNQYSNDMFASLKMKD